ncbi:MAG: ComF family protein [bacterium]
MLSLLFPHACRICQTRLAHTELAPGKICSACWSTLEYILPPYCQKCGHPSGDGHTASCGHCQLLIPVFSFARAVAIYDGVLREAIHLFKFKYRQELAEPLANLMIQYLDKTPEFADLKTYDYLVPVPLYQGKLRDREFNQVELLANHIAYRVLVPVLTNNLYRKRDTVPQMKLFAEQRMQNVVNAFAVRDPDVFYNKRILLLDDIMTTGATINECSRVLLNARAKQVAVLVLARG